MTRLTNSSPAKPGAVDILEFVRLLRHTEGRFAGQLFEPEPWQADYLGKLFNTRRPDGRRQYQRSFLGVPRKAGKTATCAAVACFEGFFGDEGGQILVAAGDRAQAGLLFTAASRYIESNPGLAKRSKIYKSAIVVPHKNTTIKFISRESKTKHGYNPSLVLVDEYHVQPNRDLVDVLESGMGMRTEPLVIFVTTAGMDRVGPCYEEWQRALKIQQGVLKDETYLPCLYYADEQDDPFDEATWKKANPNYGVTVRKEFMEREAALARESPSHEVKFRTLYLNQWCSVGANKFFKHGAFEACGEPIGDLEGRSCYAAIDLGSTKDTTAFAAVWPPSADDPEGPWDVMVHFFIPEDTARERSREDHVPYIEWAMDGPDGEPPCVRMTGGDICDYDVVRDYALAFCEKYAVRGVAIDRWNAAHLTTQLASEGIDMKPFGQGYASMSSPTKLLETLVMTKKLRHGGQNRCLMWQARNLQVKQDAAENLKPTKEHSSATGRIDGMVALIMAIGIASGEARTEPDEPTLLVL
jgi:phage terminase large subunit-like protein